MDFPPQLLRRAAPVRLLVTDVDGVWTDGRILMDAEGRELVAFHAHDGFGLRRLQEAGVRVVLISGRENPAVAIRARRLGIEEVHLGRLDKADCLREVRAKHGLTPEAVAAMGDDLPDLGLFAGAGLALAPPGAVEEVRRQAHYVTRSAGGRGAIREVCELLLAAR